MRKGVFNLFIVMCIACGLSAQQLQNTQWTAQWEQPLAGEVNFRFQADTLYIIGGSGIELETARYTEIDDTITLHDISGAYVCPSFQLGVYKFNITNGGSNLSFTAIADECIERSTNITSSLLTLNEPSGVNAPYVTHFEIYPNPASNVLHIVSSGYHSVILYDSAGRKMDHSIFYNKLDINTSSYPRGAYTVLLDRDTQKLILE